MRRFHAAGLPGELGEETPGQLHAGEAEQFVGVHETTRDQFGHSTKRDWPVGIVRRAQRDDEFFVGHFRHKRDRATVSGDTLARDKTGAARMGEIEEPIIEGGRRRTRIRGHQMAQPHPERRDVYLDAETVREGAGGVGGV